MPRSSPVASMLLRVVDRLPRSRHALTGGKITVRPGKRPPIPTTQGSSIIMKTLAKLATATALTAASVAPAFAETWDMPMAYSGSNFHSQVGAEFANCVTKGTGGDIEITTHPSGSLFAGNDIKRAVQTGQVPIGERLLSGHQNENPLFGFDSVPFLATSFEDSQK